MTPGVVASALGRIGRKTLIGYLATWLDLSTHPRHSLPPSLLPYLCHALSLPSCFLMSLLPFISPPFSLCHSFLLPASQCHLLSMASFPRVTLSPCLHPSLPPSLSTYLCHSFFLFSLFLLPELYYLLSLSLSLTLSASLSFLPPFHCLRVLPKSLVLIVHSPFPSSFSPTAHAFPVSLPLLPASPPHVTVMSLDGFTC